MRWLHLQFSLIQRFLSKLPLFSLPEKYSLGFLNTAQFLGALNDNIYKLVLIFFLIELEGLARAPLILSTVAAIFVIPFLLFSSAAGILADRLSKSKLLTWIKCVEILIFLLVIVAFALKEKTWGYALLFLLSTHSSLFGPSKYGIIPELVPKDKVSKANGLITSFTYLAIIVGTFLASFLTEITQNNYSLVGGFCLFFSVIGFLSTFGVKYTPPKGSQKKIQLFFIRQLIQTLLDCKQKQHLLLATFSSAYFLFIGAFTQLNIIPFAIQALGFTQIAGGYLFLLTAMGIALGAILAGIASKKQVELGLSCLSTLFISFLFFILSASTAHLFSTVIALFLLGVAGGIFVVPFETFIQLFSPETNRGHVIAATNFLSFLGVLLASFALYLFNEVLGLTAAKSFGVIGGITLLFFVVLLLRLSDLFLSYTGKKLLQPFLRIQTTHLDIIYATRRPLLMLEEGTPFKAWLLCSLIPHLHFLIPQYKVRRFPWFQHLFYSLHRIDSPQKFENLVDHGKEFLDTDAIPCIYLLKKKPIPEKQFFSLKTTFSRKKYEIILINIDKVSGEKKVDIRFSKQ